MVLLMVPLTSRTPKTHHFTLIEQGGSPVKKTPIVLIALISMAAPALAAGAKYFLEIDTVGNCSIVDSKPGAHAGMTILGDKNGYASKEDAAKALKALPKGKCKGVVG
jgi:hypothetical protein